MTFVLDSAALDSSLGEAVFPSHLNRMNISHFRNSTAAESHNDPTMGPSALLLI